MNGYSPKLPLSKKTDGLYDMNLTAVESIKQDLKMLLLTSPGERVMLPEYGVGIRNLLFSQNTSELKTALMKDINFQIKKYMNFIRIDNISIETNEQSENGLDIQIIYSIPSMNVTEEMNLFIGSN